jgi:hypothetical protein
MLAVRQRDYPISEQVMKRLMTGVTGLAFMLASAAAPLAAQGIGVAVGTLVPQGDMSNGAKTGFAGIASLELGGRVAFRAEALWANSNLNGVIIHSAPDGTPVPDNANVSGHVQLVGGLGSIVLHLGIGPIQPYVLGGAGYYNRSDAQKVSGAVESISDLNSKTSKIGYHFGAGLKITVIGISAFGEVRYHTVDTNNGKTNFIPIVVGVRF